MPPDASPPPLVQPHPIAAYCRASEALRRADAASRPARVERREAQRSLSSLLGDSMVRHGVDCVPLPTGDGNEYVCLVRSGPRACPLRTVDDAMQLLEGGVAQALQEVSNDDLPKAVSQLLLARARAKGPPPPPPKPKVVRNPPRAHEGKPKVHAAVAAATRGDPPPPETRTLSEEFAAAVREGRKDRQQLKPLREALRCAERDALPCVDAARSTAVQVSGGDNPQVLHVSHRPSPAHAKRRFLGIRLVCATAQDATASVLSRLDGRAQLDAHLHAELRTRLEHALEGGGAARPAAPRLHILRRIPKASASAAATAATAGSDA